MAPDQFDRLIAAMKITAGSRFNAAQRLDKNDRNLTWITAMTSVYIVTITILPYFWKLPTEIINNLNFVTVVFSIVILVSALLHNSRRDAVNAEQHHRSALEVNELRRELLAYDMPLDKDRLIDVSARYSATLQKYSVNHSELDYRKFQVERPDEFPWIGFLSRLRIKTIIVILGNIQMFSLLCVTMFFLWLVFFYAFPSRVSV